MPTVREVRHTWDSTTGRWNTRWVGAHGRSYGTMPLAVASFFDAGVEETCRVESIPNEDLSIQWPLGDHRARFQSTVPPKKKDVYPTLRRLTGKRLVEL